PLDHGAVSSRRTVLLRFCRGARSLASTGSGVKIRRGGAETSGPEMTSSRRLHRVGSSRRGAAQLPFTRVTSAFTPPSGEEPVKTTSGTLVAGAEPDAGTAVARKARRDDLGAVCRLTAEAHVTYQRALPAPA